MSELLLTLIERCTLAISKDNGEKITDSTRLDLIRLILKDTQYQCLNQQGVLCFIYGTHTPLPDEHVILVSSHIDSLYNNPWFQKGRDWISGTFDNSVTNAICLALMKEGGLPDNVFFSFTLDEELLSKGAAETIAFFKKNVIDYAVVCDVTEEGYETLLDVSLENIFVPNKKQFMSNAVPMLLEAGIRFQFIVNAEPDESWLYKEYKIPCFSHCIPIRCFLVSNKDNDSDGMHSDLGQEIRTASLIGYKNALRLLCFEKG